MFSLACNLTKNDVKFLPIVIPSKEVRGNNVHFSTIEIKSKKVGGKNVDISISEITSKKYVEMTWKFVEIWSSTYRRNIGVDSTFCARWDSIAFKPLCFA